MAHFAKLGIDNEVIEIVYMETILTMTNGGLEDENIGIAYLKKHHGHENWKKCSYNTKRGAHRAGGTPYRGSYPKLGWFYNSSLDKFVEPRPLDKDGEPDMKQLKRFTTNIMGIKYPVGKLFLELIKTIITIGVIYLSIVFLKCSGNGAEKYFSSPF